MQLFAPFTVGSVIKKNTAEAAEIEGMLFAVTTSASSDTTITATLVASISNEIKESIVSDPYTSLFLVINLNNADGTPAKPEDRRNIFTTNLNLIQNQQVTQSVSYSELNHSTSYDIVARIEGTKGVTPETLKSVSKNI